MDTHETSTYYVYMPPTSAQLSAFLRRLRAAVDSGCVELTANAIGGARDLGWTAEDIRWQLAELSQEDFLRIEDSTAPEGGRIWVFLPEMPEEGHLWIRLTERRGIVVISFHRGDP